jgi:hypothetical protein
VVTGLTVTNASVASLNAGTATITTGNLNFSSTAQRITGDFSNATVANRLMFQNSVTNGATSIYIIPNGTSTTSQFVAANNSDPTNASVFQIQSNATESQLRAGITGTGSYLPMTFYTGGSERVRIDTSGQVGIGATPSAWTATFKVLQISSSSLYNNNANATFVGSNYFFDGTNNKYINSATASAYAQNGGEHIWYNAASGTAGNNVTFTERMRIDTSGNVGIGTSSTGFNAAGLPLVVGSGSGNTGMTIYSGTASGGSIHFADTVTTGADGYRGFLNYTHNTNSMQFGTDATERMRIDSVGRIGLGGTPDNTDKFSIKGALPSASNFSIGIGMRAEVPSTTTTAAQMFTSLLYTQAASFTLTDFRHFHAQQVSIGAGSAITNQYGYFADSSLTGATNNYGFYSNIASGSNRWNFYAAGTAQNYFAGDTGIGTATISTTYGKLTVGGGITIADDQNAKFQIGRYSSGVANSYIKIGTNSNSLRISNAADTNDLFVFDNTGELIVGTTDNGAYNLQCNGTGVWGAGAYVNGSDARLKDNIATLNDGLNVVSQLRPVTFKYKPDYSKDQNVQTGFIAQELQAVLTGKDYVDGIVQAGPNHLNVAYQSLIPILVKAIQELTARVAELEAK